MLKTPYSNPALQHAIEIGTESEVCFATGTTCLSLGAFASAAELLFPGSTLLGALWIVGCFYLVLGVVSKAAPNTAAASKATANQRLDKRRCVFAAKARPPVLAPCSPEDTMSFPLQAVDRL